MNPVKIILLFCLAYSFVREFPKAEYETSLGTGQVSLGNIANFGIIGNRQTVLRFLATESGSMVRFNWWWRAGKAGHVNKPGSWSYSAGDGGRYRIELQGDTAEGKPDGDTLDSTEYYADLHNLPVVGVPEGANNAFRPAHFAGGAVLERGKWYNLVFTNISEDPIANYSSLNGTFSRDNGYSNARFEINEMNATKPGYFKRNSGSLNYMPAWAITLGNGKQIGQPYLYGDYWTGQHKVGGVNHVQQNFFITEPTNVSRLHLCATRVYGNSRLRANIFVDGVYVQQVYFTASRWPTLSLTQPDPNKLRLSGSDDFKSFKWRSRGLEDLRLKAGQRLQIQLVSQEGSCYYVPAQVKAGSYTGINSCKLVGGGFASYSEDSGKTWKPWKLRSGQHTFSIDLSLYLN